MHGCAATGSPPRPPSMGRLAHRRRPPRAPQEKDRRLSLVTCTSPPPTRQQARPADAVTGGGDRTPRRRIRAGTPTAVAALLVFAALVVPDQLGSLGPGQSVPAAFLRIPLEGILGAALFIGCPARARRLVAVLLGTGLGLLTVVKIINMGFLSVLGRRFDPVFDWPLFRDGFDYLADTSGRTVAIAAVLAAVVLVAAVPAVLTVSVVRLARVTARYRGPATRTVTALVAVWTVLALLGTQVFAGAPVASDGSAALAKKTLLKVPAALRDREAFAAEARVDAFRDTPGDQLLGALRGKDVVFAVVESYGRSALEDPRQAAIVVPVLTAGNRRLAEAGFAARSGFLTSSTFGGGSWLAHASFQSGLWIDNQQRYRQLVSGERLTLTSAFRKAGWRTVAVEPGNDRAWPEADFYGYDEVYDSRNLGYRGPPFGWSSMPDQFTLASFQRNVYSRPGTSPLMAEITLTSSHTPWTPLPQLIDWNAVGDGSVYGAMVGQDRSRAGPGRNRNRIRTEYARSVAYSMDSVLSWVRTYADDDLVLVVFGDHQAKPTVSGQGAGHDVPISIIAHDPAVLARISEWGWQDGLKPGKRAPVARMDTFRDRFLTAFGAPGPPA